MIHLKPFMTNAPIERPRNKNDAYPMIFNAWLGSVTSHGTSFPPSLLFLRAACGSTG